MELKYKKYDPILKEKAVLLCIQRGSVAEVGEELNLPMSLLFRWRQEYLQFGASSFCGQGNGGRRLNMEQLKIKRLKSKLKQTQQKFDILKNAHKNPLKVRVDIFLFIAGNEKKYSIKRMCKMLGVCEMSYRRWKKGIIPERQIHINLLKETVKSIFFEFKQKYGAYKIAMELQSRGYQISRPKVSRYLNQLDLKCKRKKRCRITTNSFHNKFVSPNILNRKFKVDAPSKVWVSDITYIKIREGFIYLTIILDLFDRKIIGWSLSNGMSSERTTIPAFQMAIINRNITNKLIFHSDRGVQYANKSFTAIVDSYPNVTRSMSHKGSSIDNAVAESFFNTLKRELIRKLPLLSKEEMKTETYEFIENWYNKKRIHSSLNYKTIEEFNALN
ncbi:transposase InsO family protein/transposase-like protein [Flavobacterium sp. 2755]|uniref:IS3 family transposase n=1 Tax=Flavobacterium sp. 2755 TaxID=2817765 RepID=UPI00285D7CB7|nr:IS3 family transposase [Flavobacterium sp. 2755]MDR6763663.1 transposase InsO family protein/transposase-like protein [Flavobacterium sp. 2755]